MLSELERQETRRALKAALSDGKAVETVRLARALVRSGKPADAMFCASAFESLKDALAKDAGYTQIKTFIVRSVTVEPFLPFLAVEAVLSGCVLEIRVGGYGSYIDEMLDPDSPLSRSKANLVLVLFDLEEIAGRLESLCATGSGVGVDEEIAEAVLRVEQMLRTYRSNCRGRVILQGCVVPSLTSLGDVGDANLSYSLPGAVKELNRRLAEICHGISDCFFFDVDQVAGRFGKAAWSDRRLFFASRLPLSPGAFSAYAQALAQTISVLFKAPRKVLCTDLDNTLWGGVLGEDGPMGIATGGAFPGNCYLDYQRYLKRLAKRGVLLATVSKNNAADVTEAFDLRSADLALKLDDFVAHKISWSDKSEAIQELADELALFLFGYRVVSGPFGDPIQKVSVNFMTTSVEDATEIELIAPLTEDSPIRAMLNKSGGGAYHLCFQTNDLEAALTHVRSKGCMVLGQPQKAVAFGGRPIAWVYTATRQLFELVEQG